MYLRTCHGTFVVADRDDGRLRHVACPEASHHRLVDVGQGLGGDDSSAALPDGSLIQSGPLTGYLVYSARAQDGFYLSKDGYFLCAELECDELICNRLTPGPYELFTSTEIEIVNNAQPQTEEEPAPTQGASEADTTSFQALVWRARELTGDDQAAVGIAIDELSKYRDSEWFFPWGAHALLHVLVRAGRREEALALTEVIDERNPEFCETWWTEISLTVGTGECGHVCKRIINRFRKLTYGVSSRVLTPLLQSLTIERPYDFRDLLARLASEGIIADILVDRYRKVIQFLSVVESYVDVMYEQERPACWSFGVFGRGPIIRDINGCAFINVSMLGVDDFGGWDFELASRLAFAVSWIMGWAMYYDDEGVCSWATTSYEERFAAVFCRLLAYARNATLYRVPSQRIRFKSAAMDGRRGQLLVRTGGVELWALWNVLCNSEDALRAAELVAVTASETLATSELGRPPVSDTWPRIDALENITRLNVNAGWYASPTTAARSLLDWASRYSAALRDGEIIEGRAAELLPVMPFIPGLRHKELGEWSEDGFLKMLIGADVVFVTAYAEELQEHYLSGTLSALWREIAPGMNVSSLQAVAAPMSVWPYYPDDSWSTTFDKLCEESARTIETASANFFIASCGAYGLPLVHEMHRRFQITSLYCGHRTNIYFGIVTNDGKDNPFYMRRPQSANWRKVDISLRFPHLARIDGGRYVGTNVPTSVQE